MTYFKNAACTFLFLYACVGLHAQGNPADSLAIVTTVLEYDEGFQKSDKSLVLNALSGDLIFTGGNYSDNPDDWQAHMFLSGNDLEKWVDFMLNNAGPFENDIRISHCAVRGKAAVLVTTETGRNQFRTWKDDKVVYLLGRLETGWKIKSVFIRNARNP